MNIQSISSITNSGASATSKAISQKAASTGKSGGTGGAGKSKPASSSNSSSDETTTYDKMDLNKDGTVTTAEKAQYLLMHPDEAFQNRTNSYNYQGTQDEKTGGISGLINLTA